MTDLCSLEEFLQEYSKLEKTHRSGSLYIHVQYMLPLD
jgi:hypothetical protein